MKIIVLKNYFPDKKTYVGWGFKYSGLKAIEQAHKEEENYLLLEDGFIRSYSNLNKQISLIKDNIGIYYNAKQESYLENLINTKKFYEKEINDSKEIIQFIIEKK